MSQGRTKTSPLQDIPLTVEDQNTMMSEMHNISKTGTIRRFFKLPSKKSEIAPDSKSEGDVQKSESKDFEEPRRFHLRLGNKQRTDDQTADLEEMPTSSAQNMTNRLTLKKSIFKYWQNIFKNVKSSHSSTSFKAEVSDKDLAQTQSSDINSIEQKENADEPEIATVQENNVKDAVQTSSADLLTEADNNPEDESINQSNEETPITTN